MANTLVFPDGVRLAMREDLPGPQKQKEEMWARIERARIAPGFVVKTTDDARFQYYAEANVDAPMMWAVFRDLSESLLAPEGTLLLAFKDDDPKSHW